MWTSNVFSDLIHYICERILFEINKDDDKLLFTVFLKYKVYNNNRNQYEIIMTTTIMIVIT